MYLDINECSSNPCKNPQATCVDDIGTYRCACPREWTGALCETS